MCDDADKCTKICVITWDTLYRIDFILSFQMITVVATYSVNTGFVIYKILILLATLISNTIYVVKFKKYDTNDNPYIGVLIAIAFVAIVIQCVYLWKKGKLCNDLKYHFDWRVGIIALVCAVIGIYLFLSSRNDDKYWLLHSFWHIFIALAIFFEFMMYDIYEFCCCIDKSQCECPECSDFANLNNMSNKQNMSLLDGSYRI